MDYSPIWSSTFEFNSILVYSNVQSSFYCMECALGSQSFVIGDERVEFDWIFTIL